jgi:hypothetical protein
MASRFALEGHQHAGVGPAGVSNIGNTSGNTTVMHGQVVLAGGNNITLSVSSSNNNAQTITFSGANTGMTITRFCNMALLTASAQQLQPMAAPVASIMLFPLTPMDDDFPGNMTLSTLLMNVSIPGFTASSSFTLSVSLGVYSTGNSSSLSLLYQAQSTVAQAAASNNSNSFAGARWLSFHSSLFSNSAGVATTPSFVQGSYYWVGIVLKTSNLNISLSHLGAQFQGTGQRSGTVGAGSSNATTLKWYPFMGINSSGTLPTGIAASSINAANASAGFIPCLIFENQISLY